MQDYWNSFVALTLQMQVFWACAILGSFVFAVQIILTMLGIDGHDADVDFVGADVDGDTLDMGGGLSLFSVRNLVNFAVGFGWAGVCLDHTITNRLLLSFVAFLVGIAFVLMFFYIKRQTRKLEHNGAFQIEDCVGRSVDVYLRIPAGKSGRGKVQVSLNGSVQELDAVTEGDMIASGQKADVLRVIDGSTLLVARSE